MQHSLNAPTHETKLLRWATIFFLCLLLLTASGRIASLDAGFQLQGSMVLATTGHFGATVPPEGVDSLAWVQGIDGRYYEVHDIGNILFMLPPALFGVLAARHAPIDLLHPPLLTRVLVSLMDAALSAVACIFLFRLFRRFVNTRTAVLLACAFLTTTLFWSYTKAAWDVLPACCFLCMALDTAVALLLGRNIRSHLIATCLFIQLAGMFRLSMLPSLTLALLLLAFFARQQLSRTDLLLGSLTYAVLLAPNFWFNWIRTGSILKPATSLPRFVDAGTADLSGSLWVGLRGLAISPNKGLFVFCPVLLLIFALPMVWKQIPLPLRTLLLAFAPGTLLYVLLIARLKLWNGNYGWGPRYLVPVLPVFFVAAACVLVLGWKRYRVLFLALLALSFLINAPTALVNIHLVQSEDVRTRYPDQPLPYEILFTWRDFGKGLAGRPLNASEDELSDPVRRLGADFPDIWTAYLIRSSPRAAPIGFAIILALGGGCVFAARRLWQADAPTAS